MYIVTEELYRPESKHIYTVYCQAHIVLCLLQYVFLFKI